MLPCLLLLLISGLVQIQAKPPGSQVAPLERLLRPQEYATYRNKSRYKDRMALFRKAFKARRQRLESAVQQDDVNRTLELLRQLSSLSHYVASERPDARHPKDLRAKSVKKLEIDLRKLILLLDSLQATMSYEQYDAFERTKKDLSELRDRLLRNLFGPALGQGSARARNHSGAGWALVGKGTMAQHAPRNLLADQDRFTDLEFTRIQQNQELGKRAKVFLEIAEARLGEIDRRLHHRAWESEEENPLEFYTYADLIHAYRRALDSLMENIDEKVGDRTPDKKIRKTLKLLLRKTEAFLPQLDAVQGLATRQKDQRLFQEVNRARESTVVAQKGALYALGAPEKK